VTAKQVANQPENQFVVRQRSKQGRPYIASALEVMRKQRVEKLVLTVES
jgi:hypothetical protein